MALSRIAGAKACNHQVSGSGTILPSWWRSTSIPNSIAAPKLDFLLVPGWTSAAVRGANLALDYRQGWREGVLETRAPDATTLPTPLIKASNKSPESPATLKSPTPRSSTRSKVGTLTDTLTGVVAV